MPSNALVVDISEPPDAIVKQILPELRRPHADMAAATHGRKGDA